MDLEELDLEYQWLKDRLAQSKSRVKYYEQEIQRLGHKKKIAVGEESFAILRGDKNEEQQAKQEQKRIDQEIVRTKQKAEQEKERLNVVQARIDEKINQIKQDPEMQEYVDSVLEKRYDRKVKSLNNKMKDISESYEESLKPLQEKVSKLSKIQQIIQSHPEICSYIVKISEASYKIEECENKLAEIHPESVEAMRLKGSDITEDETKMIEDEALFNEAFRDPDTNITLEEFENRSKANCSNLAEEMKLKENTIIENKKKIEENKSLLNEVLGGTGTDITLEDLVKVLNNNQVRSQNGKVKIRKTIDNNLKLAQNELQSLIKSYEIAQKQINKNILKNQAALDALKAKRMNNITKKSNQIKDSDGKRKDKTNNENNNEKRSKKGKKNDNRLKWWQFRARWKRNKMRRLGLLEGSVPKTSTNSSDRNKFIGSLRYEIVKDIVKQEQKEMYRNAKVNGEQSDDRTID